MPVGLRERVQRSGKVYYYLDTGERPRREIPLGDSYPLAIRKWAELVAPATDELPLGITFSWLSDQYLKRVVPKKALRTQRDNVAEMKSLVGFFTSGSDAPIDQIRPHHIAKFLEWRGQTAPVRANREKALLSHMLNWAREMGYLEGANPCAGVRAHSESGRDFYVTDELLENILMNCDRATAFALRLMYLSGQRQGDVLNMRRESVQDFYLAVVQQKTGVSLQISLCGESGKRNELGMLVEELLDYQSSLKVDCSRLLVTENGLPLTADTLRSRFDTARIACASRLRNIGRKDLAKEIERMQMRDLRAKAATDIESATGSAREAQKLLAHRDQSMTERYIRNRRGARVNPTK
jgi:integrase